MNDEDDEYNGLETHLRLESGKFLFFIFIYILLTFIYRYTMLRIQMWGAWTMKKGPNDGLPSFGLWLYCCSVY